ncbi:MAG: hypothetical protein RM347_034670 [Nostoc sp. ChiQUE02]|nr:hypothetical protein [Nostoc sp. ChiQUE02]
MTATGSHSSFNVYTTITLREEPQAMEGRSLTIGALSQKYSTELFTSIKYINLL